MANPKSETLPSVLLKPAEGDESRLSLVPVRTQCGLCLAEQAEWWCEECARPLCGPCRTRYHEGNPLLESHHLMEASDVSANSSSICLLHRNSQLKIKCACCRQNFALRREMIRPSWLDCRIVIDGVSAVTGTYLESRFSDDRPCALTFIFRRPSWVNRLAVFKNCKIRKTPLVITRVSLECWSDEFQMAAGQPAECSGEFNVNWQKFDGLPESFHWRRNFTDPEVLNATWMGYVDVPETLNGEHGMQVIRMRVVRSIDRQLQSSKHFSLLNAFAISGERVAPQSSSSSSSSPSAAK